MTDNSEGSSTKAATSITSTDAMSITIGRGREGRSSSARSGWVEQACVHQDDTREKQEKGACSCVRSLRFIPPTSVRAPTLLHASSVSESSHSYSYSRECGDARTSTVRIVLYVLVLLSSTSTSTDRTVQILLWLCGRYGTHRTQRTSTSTSVGGTGRVLCNFVLYSYSVLLRTPCILPPFSCLLVCDSYRLKLVLVK